VREEVRRQARPEGRWSSSTVDRVEKMAAPRRRHVHVLEPTNQGLASTDHMWCGGRWPATALLAEMEAASDAG